MQFRPFDYQLRTLFWMTSLEARVQAGAEFVYPATDTRWHGE